MADITIREYKIHSLKNEYIRYSRHIFNTQRHVNKCLQEHIIDINNRNNYLKTLNDIYRATIIQHNKYCKENNENPDLLKNISLPQSINFDNDSNIYEDVKNIMNFYKKYGIDTVGETIPTIFEAFDDPFAEIRNKLISFGNKIGFLNLNNAMSIIIGDQYLNLYSDKVKELLKICGKIFIPIKYTEKNSSKNKATFSAKKIHKPLSETLIDNCAEIIIKNKVTGKYMVFIGYFVNDSLNIIYRTSGAYDSFLDNKRKAIERDIKKIDYIDKSFQDIYIKNCLLSDFIILSTDEFIKHMEDDYERHKELVRLRFMDLMKEFITEVNGLESIQNMYNIIRLLLLGSKENINVAGLLFDVTKDRKNKNETIANIIYRNLRYVSQIKLRKTYSDIKNELERIKSITFNDIDLEKQIALCKSMPDYAKRAAMVKLDEMKSSNNEYHKQLLYVKTLINYPWPNEDDDRMFIDIGKSKEKTKSYVKSIDTKLSEKVYGHQQCKDTISEVIAKLITNPDGAGCAIGLVGPPGVGKTLIAKAIGKGLDIPFVQITLGGQNDGELLHGHGYTYSAAQPGMVVKKMVEAGSSRCIMYFDELDKACRKVDGNEIFNILIHMTDPNTNDEFQDRFFQEINFSLRNVIYIFSYNDSSLIDPILLDRIKEIQVKPYSLKDKVNIAKDFLIKEICKEIGFDNNLFNYSDKILEYLATNHTNEPGVRDLRRKIESIMLKLNKDRIFDEGPYKDNTVDINNPLDITEDIVANYLGKSKLKIRKIHSDHAIGVVNGLYATQSGQGGIIPIQIYPNILSTKDKHRLLRTGNQKEIMVQSNSTALTMAKHIIKPKHVKDFLKKYPHGFHIHTPDGHTPKDGPSAGTAFTTAFASVILNKKVRHDLAMTGEIEFMGKVNAIGGLRYKLTGAKKAGIRTVLVPLENKEDIDQINKDDPELIDNDKLTVKFVDHIYDVLKEALVDFDETQINK